MSLDRKKLVEIALKENMRFVENLTDQDLLDSIFWTGKFSECEKCKGLILKETNNCLFCGEEVIEDIIAEELIISPAETVEVSKEVFDKVKEFKVEVSKEGMPEITHGIKPVEGVTNNLILEAFNRLEKYLNRNSRLSGTFDINNYKVYLLKKDQIIQVPKETCIGFSISGVDGKWKNIPYFSIEDVDKILEQLLKV